MQDGHQVSRTLATALAGRMGTTFTTGVGTPSISGSGSAVTITYGAGATVPENVETVQLTEGTTIEGSMPSGTGGESFCVSATYEGQVAVYQMM